MDELDIKKLLVKDLREHLSKRGLSTKGVKAVLVKRLEDALLAEGRNDDVQAEQDVARESDDDSSERTDEERMEVEEEIEEERREVEERLRIEAEREEQERARIEAEQKAEEERLRIEAEEEKLRIEAERKAEEERLRIEAERKAEEEILRIEAERKAEEERLRIEAERKAEEERLRIEAEREAEKERMRIEAEKEAEKERLRIEAERKTEEERLRIEAQRKAEEERLRIEAEKKEERLRIEAEKKAEIERMRIEAEKEAEAERMRIEAEKKEAERLRLETERKAEEEQLRIEAQRKAEAQRIRIEAEKKAEAEKMRIEAEKKAEAERLKLEAEKKAETERLRLEAEKKAEERSRIEAQQKAEAERLRLEAKRRAEEEQLRIIAQRKEEERLVIEAERKAEEERLRILEEKRKAEEALKEKQRMQAEMQRLEEEKRKAEEQKKIEERRKDEQRSREENRRIEEEEKRKAERERKIKEQRMAEEEEMRREQEKWLVEEQMRKAQEEHKKRLKAEEQKRLLAEEKQKHVFKEQQMIAEKQHSLATTEEVRKQKEKESDPEQSSLSKGVSSTGPASFSLISSPLNIPPPPPTTAFMSNFPPPPPPIPPSNALIKSNVPVTQGAPAGKFALSHSNIKSNPSGEFQILSESEVQELDLNFDAEENMDTSEAPSDIKLPQALEKVLALKTERAQQLGVDPDSVVQPDQVNEEKTPTPTKPTVVSLVSVDDDEYIDDENAINKNKDAKSKRRKKKKKKRHNEKITEGKKDATKRSEASKETSVDIDIEYVQEVIDISDPLYSQFMKIFEKFKLTENEKGKEDMATDASKDANKEESINPMALRKKPMDLDDDDEQDEDEKQEEEKPKLSKRKLKKLSRMTVAELKQKVNRPELVEMHDVTAKDPVLLLHLKASRNTVPVPRHWCFKRKYLQGKRGIEKPAFELPDFIKRTGIMEMRQALQEKEDQKTMKAKMRERVRPKLGKIDIDYQKLHDAFFKWQTKPRMTIHGDLYYEGKEFETRLKEKKPGDLSDDLRTALGMPTGPNANKCPPPWLIAMQRYGPPPSYPNLKIPGLNAPIPDSCSFGYHAGGWGKPPVDETGRPLYGDVFGTQIIDNQPHIQEEEIDHTLWGELESESSEEEEEDEEDEEEEEEEKTEDESGLVTPAEGLITPSGFSSIPAGMETPDMIELRKRKIEAELEGGETPALYTILPEKKTERLGAAMMGSTHIYDLAAAIPGSKLKMPGTASVPPQGIEVALDPSELEMDTAAMAARYEQTMREQQSQLEKEDLSDMVAEHAARQKNKRKKQQMDSAKPPKKYKEFKF